MKCRPSTSTSSSNICSLAVGACSLVNARRMHTRVTVLTLCVCSCVCVCVKSLLTLFQVFTIK